MGSIEWKKDPNQLQNKEEEHTLIKKFDNGGIVWRHNRVNCNDKDHLIVEKVAIDKALLGNEVFILPVLVEDDRLREIIFAESKNRKCPDLKINNIYYEIKCPLNPLHDRKINNNIKFAYDQANHVIIILPASYSLHRLWGIAKGRFLSHKTLEVIEYKMNGQYYIFERGQILK